MRILMSVVLLTVLLLATAAQAQDKCGTLRIFDSIQMFRGPDNEDLIPVTINGAKAYYLFDTGGYYTQIGRPVAQDLKLPVRQGNIQMFDATGHISRDVATIHEFIIGHMRGTDVYFPVSPFPDLDGIFALDHLMSLDVDLDFGTDKLNLFSPDHCPGSVLYWTAPALAIVPIVKDGFHLTVPVTLDGHEIKATIDTGATKTNLRMDLAERTYNLTMSTPDTPDHGFLNGDTSLKTYSHVFKTLTFGDVAVNNPNITIIPNAAGRNADRAQLVADRTKSEKDFINVPELIIGMDVLSSLHIYVAFKENKMYVSAASVPSTGAVFQPLPDDYIAAKLQRVRRTAEANPDGASALNDLCYWRGVAKNELDAALADCDKSIKLKPGIAAMLDSRAFVLYQQGKYQEALDAYDAVLKIDSRHAASLLVRGYTKGKLGDSVGKDADIAAAKAYDPGVQMEFKRFGVTD
jgi:hypothetical protein